MRQADAARVAEALYPARGKGARRKACADSAGEMRQPLAPINAAAADRAAVAAERRHIDAKAREAPLALAADVEISAVLGGTADGDQGRRSRRRGARRNGRSRSAPRAA